jgi:hypothetical protein
METAGMLGLIYAAVLGRLRLSKGKGKGASVIDETVPVETFAALEPSG